MRGLRQENFPANQTVLHSVGLSKRKNYPPILPRTILIDYTVQVIPGTLVHPILEYTKGRAVGCLEADLGVVGRAF